MTPHNKLGTYLAVTLGTGAAATSANAATMVTLYGDGVTPPTGINVGTIPDGTGYADLDSLGSSRFLSTGSTIFTRGTDLSGLDQLPSGKYYSSYWASFHNGAQFGSENFANISFNGDDGVYESVGQFYFDGAEGGYLIALATNDDASALSISAGKAAIDSLSAVPEPSSHLALLALGSAGLLTRRRLKRAA